MLAESFRVAPAIVFYLLYAAGLTFFAVLPGLAEGGWRKALIWGGLLGLFAYGTYDLTNLATLKLWIKGVGLTRQPPPAPEPVTIQRRPHESRLAPTLPPQLKAD